MNPTRMNQPYNLLIDIGNTFVKWGLFRAGVEGSARENASNRAMRCWRKLPALAAQLRKLPAPAPRS